MSKTESAQEDRQLVGRFKAGDLDAYDRLVEKHSRRAYQIAYGVLRNKEDAEEVAQDVFIRIYRALTKFRGDSEFTTWMYRIAMNLARNKYRWNMCRGSNKNVSINAPVGGDGENEGRTLDVVESRLPPDMQAQVDEFETRAMKELQQLPELYREALVLRNIEEMNYEDIALLLGCKLGTIKSRIARAREQLRKKLAV